MLIDSLTLAGLADELRADLLRARVQDVLQPDRVSVALELYSAGRVYLTLSADPAREGVELSAARARRGSGAPSPLALAMRAHLVGSRLREVLQPPHERLLVFTFEGADTRWVIAEATGRLANVVLVGPEGTVLAAARHVTGRMTRARVVLPGRRYQPPPPPAKAVPESVDRLVLSSWLAASSDPAWRVVVDHVRGASPLLAREAVHRACGSDDAPAAAVDAGELAIALADLFGLRSGGWTPCVARSDGRAVAYASYWLGHLAGTAEVASAPSVSEAAAVYVADRIGADPYRDARAGVAARLGEAVDRARRRVESLRRETVGAEELERLRLAGDLILAFQTAIPPGAELFEPPEGAGLSSIRLDRARSPVDNARAYYDRYRRRKRAAEAQPERLARAEATLATLDQLAADLQLSEDRAGIDAVHDALVGDGHAPGRARVGANAASRPLTLESSDGLTILVGRNSRQNEQVTFVRGARGDAWLHARGIPGGHVVVKSAGRPVPPRTLAEAAALAAHYSRARGEGRVDVVVTDVRHVRRMRGAGPGMVTYDRDATLSVEPASPGDLGLAVRPERARSGDLR